MEANLGAQDLESRRRDLIRGGVRGRCGLSSGPRPRRAMGWVRDGRKISRSVTSSPASERRSLRTLDRAPGWDRFLPSGPRTSALVSPVSNAHLGSGWIRRSGSGVEYHHAECRRAYLLGADILHLARLWSYRSDHRPCGPLKASGNEGRKDQCQGLCLPKSGASSAGSCSLCRCIPGGWWILGRPKIAVSQPHSDMGRLRCRCFMIPPFTPRSKLV
jgi:hypothetical protein